MFYVLKCFLFHIRKQMGKLISQWTAEDASSNYTIYLFEIKSYKKEIIKQVFALLDHVLGIQ